MSAVVPLPTEIASFLRRPPPDTMLVRGRAGTGKTTFVLTLLSSFPGQRIYVTSRTRGAALARDFPWLGGPENPQLMVVDASHRTGTVRDTARALTNLRNYLVEGDTEFERGGLWMPAPLQEAWSLVRPDEPAMVVIDSWDAVVERYLGVPAPLDEGLPDRAEVERLVLDQLGQGAVHTVLVLEREEANQLDYLVNGVVSTERTSVDERPERWIHIHKLRGVRLDNAAYPFTLEGARFQCITPIRPDLGPALAPPDPEPEPMPGFLWPGSEDFAANFGRLALGHISLFETETGVPEEALRLVFAPIAAHVLQNGGRVFHVLGPQVSARELCDVYRLQFPEETVLGRTRYQSALGTEEAKPAAPQVMVPLPRSGDTGAHSRTPEALRFLREGARGGPANLSIVWVSGLEALGAVTGSPYRPETLPALVLDYATETNIHEIFIGTTGDPLVESVRSMASTRLRFRSRGGRVFLYGTQPRTPAFVLAENGAARTYSLLRIV